MLWRYGSGSCLEHVHPIGTQVQVPAPQLSFWLPAGANWGMMEDASVKQAPSPSWEIWGAFRALGSGLGQLWHLGVVL